MRGVEQLREVKKDINLRNSTPNKTKNLDKREFKVSKGKLEYLKKRHTENCFLGGGEAGGEND